MTLQTNPPHETRGKNNGYFEKPSKGIAATAWGDRIVYSVPEGKYAKVTIAWDNEQYGFRIYDKYLGQHYATVGNWGTGNEDRSTPRHIENVILYAGMEIEANSSTTVSVFGSEFDL